MASWTSLLTVAFRSRRGFGILPLGSIPWKTDLRILRHFFFLHF